MCYCCCNPEPLPPLPTPTGVTAEGGDQSVTVAFGTVEGADHYTVRVCAVGRPLFECIDTEATGSPVTVPGLSPDTEYIVTVQANVAEGDETNSDSDWSAPVTATTDPAPPTPLTPPTGLSGGTPTATTIPATWNTVVNATSYVVRYRVAGSGGAYTEVPSEDASVSLTGLTPDTGYEVGVKAVGDGVEWSDSPFSTDITVSTTAAVVLPAPTGLAGTPASTSVALTWNAVANASGYTVRYRTGGGAYTEVTATGTTHNLTGLTASTEYEIGIRADGTGEFANSVYSADITSTTTA